MGHHLDLTPVNYLEWRFSGGMDREGQAKNFLELTEDEEKLIGQKPGQVEKLINRRKGKKGNEYETQFVGCQNPMEENSWMAKDNLLRMKWTDTADKKRPEYEVGPALLKLMMQVDERIAFEASGIATKKLTQLNIQKHLDCFNLETQFGTYSKISALSGGQKVKVVLAACMWMEPHVTILDEPTNFLDLLVGPDLLALFAQLGDPLLDLLELRLGALLLGLLLLDLVAEGVELVLLGEGGGLGGLLLGLLTRLLGGVHPFGARDGDLAVD